MTKPNKKSIKQFFTERTRANSLFSPPPEATTNHQRRSSFSDAHAIIIKTNGTNSHLYNIYAQSNILGVGGFSVVFSGYTLNATNDDFIDLAIKVFHKNLSAPNVERLQAEAVIAHDLGLALSPTLYYQNGQHSLVMRRIKGDELFNYINKRINNGDLISPEKALLIFTKIADAVSFVHNKGYLHRDLKPENLIINADSLDVTAIDPGFAKKFSGKKPFIRTKPEGSIEFIAKANIIKRSTGSKQQELFLRCGYSSDFYATGIAFLDVLSICQKNAEPSSLTKFTESLLSETRLGQIRPKQYLQAKLANLILSSNTWRNHATLKPWALDIVAKTKNDIKVLKFYSNKMLLNYLKANNLLSLEKIASVTNAIRYLYNRVGRDSTISKAIGNHIRTAKSVNEISTCFLSLLTTDVLKERIHPLDFLEWAHGVPAAAKSYAQIHQNYQNQLTINGASSSTLTLFMKKIKTSNDITFIKNLACLVSPRIKTMIACEVLISARTMTLATRWAKAHIDTLVKDNPAIGWGKPMKPTLDILAKGSLLNHWADRLTRPETPRKTNPYRFHSENFIPGIKPLNFGDNEENQDSNTPNVLKNLVETEITVTA